MQRFNNEPRRLKTVKQISLMVGAIGSGAFMGSILFASFGPVVNYLYKNIVLIHGLHPFLFFAMIFLNGSTTKLSFLSLYGGLYIVCMFGDMIGSVIRLVYFVACEQCTGVSGTIMWLANACDLVMVVSAALQVIISVFLARLTAMHIDNQETVVGYICSLAEGRPDNVYMLLEEAKKAKSAAREMEKEMINIKKKSNKLEKQSAQQKKSLISRLKEKNKKAKKSDNEKDSMIDKSLDDMNLSSPAALSFVSSTYEGIHNRK